jgi:uncharacterized membrane protein
VELNPVSFAKYLHIISAIIMIGGIIGRQLTRAQARRTRELAVFVALTVLAGRFELWMVQPGSLAIILTGVVLAKIQGWPIFGFLEGSPDNWLLVSILLILPIFLIIGLIFIPKGKQFGKLLEEAQNQGMITESLRKQYNDPLVKYGHYYEYISVMSIVYLMTAKPF